MHRLSFFVIFTTLVLTVIVFLIVPPPSGLQATATQNSVLSLFSEDICALPCWFGITPGESTSEDVEVFLQANEDIFTSIETSERSVFDTQTGSMLDGTYRFRWIESERDDIRYSGNWIEIRDGVVGEMRITMNSIVTLQETLDTLGSPNHVRLGLGYYTGDAILGLIYLNPHVRVDLKSQGCVTSQQI